MDNLELELTSEEIEIAYCYDTPCKKFKEYIYCTDCESLLKKGAGILLQKLIDRGDVFILNSCQYSSGVRRCSRKTLNCPERFANQEDCFEYIPLSEYKEEK